MNTIERILTRKVRIYLYGVTIAALGVAVFYGLLEPGALAVWVPLAIAIFNVPREAPEAPHAPEEPFE